MQTLRPDRKGNAMIAMSVMRAKLAFALFILIASPLNNVPQ
jgi:hypothetical protein